MEKEILTISEKKGKINQRYECPVQAESMIKNENSDEIIQTSTLTYFKRGKNNRQKSED